MIFYVQYTMFRFKLLVVLTLGSCVSISLSQELQPFELEELLSGAFKLRSQNATWLAGSQLVFMGDDGQGMYKYDVATNTKELFLPTSVINTYPGARVDFKNNGTYALITYNVKEMFRHSTTAQYAIYDLVNKQAFDIADKQFLQTVVWSEQGNRIAYVLDNNVYYMASPEAQSEQLTINGIPGVIYNGAADWVYEEEILASGQAIWFSPNGKNLAFATFDDTEVPEFEYILYGKPGSLEAQYSKVIKLRYPKVGIINPKFELNLANLDSTPIEVRRLNVTGENSEDFILSHVVWPSDDAVVAVVNTRVQDSADILRCDAQTANCQHETWFWQTGGWIDIKGPVYNTEATLALYIMAQPEGDDHYKHLVTYNVSSLRNDRLTTGERVVDEILGWDLKNNIAYYTGSVVNAPSQKQVYAVNVDTKEDKCLTCDMETPEGPCKYASAKINPDFTYIIKSCTGPGPHFAVIEKLQDPTETLIWEDNHVLRANLSEKLMPVIRDFVIDMGNGFQGRARLLLPPNLDESGSTKYPMMVNVYAGPDTTRITDQFNLDIHRYMVTNRRYIYAYIDGRGSNRYGNKLMYQMYKRMGTVEIEDQITVAKYLQDTLPYVDAQNTAIWGWSYGGFASAWALNKDTQNVFKFAFSVAPVTNFLYYDSMYTERYNGLLENNSLGYNNTDLMRNVEGFRNKTLFLVHGNADDNVHYQQSMHLARALEQADIFFYQQSYPDENHALGGVTKHLYHTLDRFWSIQFGDSGAKKEYF